MGRLLKYILLLIPLGALAFTWPNRFFQEEFESASVDSFPNTNITGTATVTIASNVVHSGLYSLKITTTDGSAGAAYYATYNHGTNYATAYGSIRLYIERLGTNFTTDRFIKIMQLVNAAGSGVDDVYIKNVGGAIKLFTDKLGNGTATITTGAWHHIEQVVDTNGTSTTYIDGVEDDTGSGLTILPVRQLSVGVRYNPYNIGCVLYFDDFVYALERTYEAAPYIRTYAPDFRARIGNSVLAITAGRSDGDIIKAWLAGPDGYSNQWHNAVATGRDYLRGTYTGIATGEYTFNILLTDSNATPRVTNTITWTKNYDGDPFWSINEYNNITRAGTNYFLVDVMCIPTNWASGYISSNLVNNLYGQSFDAVASNCVAKAIEYLDFASNQNVGVMIPVNPERSTVSGADPITTNTVLEYLTNTTVNVHPALIAWDFQDEPDVQGYDAEPWVTWARLAKDQAPGRLVHINNMGNTALGPSRTTSFFNWQGHSFCMPWQTADIYSSDVYPFEQTNVYNIHDLPLTVTNQRKWNYDTVPVMSYIGPGDITAGAKGGAPTTNQLWCSYWLAIAAGAKGIHIFPYHAGIPPANFAMMGTFTLAATRLKDVILGSTPTTHATWNNTNIWCKHTTSGTTNYWIVANASTSAQTVTLSHSDIPWGRWIYWDGGSGHITTTAGGFSDTLDAYGVRVYWLDPAQLPDRPRATVIWTTSP